MISLAQNFSIDQISLQNINWCEDISDEVPSWSLRMPGLILYNRRWSVGSDDCIIPAFILSTTHLVWLAILAPILIVTFTQASEPADSLEVSWEIYLPIRKMREHL